MKDGRWVRTTIRPLRKPIASAQAKAKRTLSVIGTWKVIVGRAIIMPEKPIIEPSERSNSPPIIKQRGADGDDHQVTADRRPVQDAIGREHPCAARGDGEEHEDENKAEECAEFGPAQELAQSQIGA